MSSPKVHIQTIGILVSEKSELQTALQYTQQAARQKSGICAILIMPTCMYQRRSQQNVPPVSVFICSWGRGVKYSSAVIKAESVGVGENTFLCVNSAEAVWKGETP